MKVKRFFTEVVELLLCIVSPQGRRMNATATNCEITRKTTTSLKLAARTSSRKHARNEYTQDVRGLTTVKAGHLKRAVRTEKRTKRTHNIRRASAII